MLTRTLTHTNTTYTHIRTHYRTQEAVVDELLLTVNGRTVLTSLYTSIAKPQPLQEAAAGSGGGVHAAGPAHSSTECSGSPGGPCASGGVRVRHAHHAARDSMDSVNMEDLAGGGGQGQGEEGTAAALLSLALVDAGLLLGGLSDYEPAASLGNRYGVCVYVCAVACVAGRVRMVRKVLLQPCLVWPWSMPGYYWAAPVRL